MSEVDAAIAGLRAAGLPYTPPHVLVTRWMALLAGDEHRYLDAAYESGAKVPGTRYTFLAITDTTVCYLQAEHGDDSWEHDRVIFNPQVGRLTPRKLVAWRRPLAHITEVSVGGHAQQWQPSPPGSGWSPTYVLKFGSDAIEIPLNSPYRSTAAPDPAPVIVRVTAAWQAGVVMTVAGGPLIDPRQHLYVVKPALTRLREVDNCTVDRRASPQILPPLDDLGYVRAAGHGHALRCHVIHNSSRRRRTRRQGRSAQGCIAPSEQASQTRREGTKPA